ncbi:hypothetical protein ABDD95_07725 [Mucilaginibacter sp. PAMB04274]|uniref:hypothetical protein n=1 Tax=Mucilaginibacter sp. PAMB04274 TaxID=3138568 RepID=UPI0031F61207
MRPVEKSARFDALGAPLEIDPYDAAKPDLCDEIGTFCSFCEKYNSRSALHVEHIYAKNAVDAQGNKIYDHLKLRWDNFLLGCVNCNGVKGKKDVAVLNPFMPHTDNLLCYLEAITGGLIVIKNGVTGNDLTRTNAYLELVGLDRVPGHLKYSDKDDRWDNRLKVYDLATRHLAKYTQVVPTTDLETIVDLAQTNGFFTVWYSVFHAFDEVRSALINGFNNAQGVLVKPFPETHAASFNAANHYNPLTRP